MYAWHPFSIAGVSNGNVELYMDVHGRDSWTGQLAQAVRRMQAEDAEDGRKHSEDAEGNRVYDPTRIVYVKGPFGSSFSRCFEMINMQARKAAPAYDIVILYGTGLGVPSAVSALCEFIARRKYGTELPTFVYFMWQARRCPCPCPRRMHLHTFLLSCGRRADAHAHAHVECTSARVSLGPASLWQARYVEDLTLAWDSLHRIIYEAGGLWDGEVYRQHRLVNKRRMPIDLEAHMRRNGGEPWTPETALLEWLGVSLHVSQMKEGGGRQLLENDNSLREVDSSVHDWLTHPGRLRAGRASLSEEVVKLVARYDTEFGATKPPPRLCVSMCGSPKMASTVAAQLKKARALLLECVGQKVDISYELMADSH